MQHQQHAARQIRALLCQVSPFYKQKDKTIARIKVSLQNKTPQQRLDIIVFPQMAFSGYNFKDPQDALPFAVCQNQGADFQFAKLLATKINAYVAFGYIQKVEVSTNDFQLYNSAAVINRSGQMICNYRKSHLYYNDKLWAREGDKFVSFELITLQNKSVSVALGICMDINPKQFASGEWQLANFCVASKSQVLLFLTNWVDSDKQKVTNNDVAATYNYWIHRLQPVISTKKTFLFLAADRVGIQYDFFAKKQTMFYGSSCAIMFNPTKIIKNLDIENEGYLKVQTYLP